MSDREVPQGSRLTACGDTLQKWLVEEQFLDFPKFRESQLPLQLPSNSVDCNAKRESLQGAQRRLDLTKLVS